MKCILTKKVPICVVEQHFHLIAIKKNITLLFYTEPLLVFNDPSGLLALILGGYINDKNEYMNNIIFKLQLGVASINVCFVCLCKILNIMRRKTQTSPPLRSLYCGISSMRGTNLMSRLIGSSFGPTCVRLRPGTEILIPLRKFSFRVARSKILDKRWHVSRPWQIEPC